MGLNKNVTVVIGIMGAILGIAGLFIYLIWGNLVWLYTTLELLAILFLSIFLVSHFEILKDISSRRSTKFGANSVTMVVIFVAILGILNFILVRHEIRVDLSDAGLFSLSPQTENILNNLGSEIKITGFFNEQSKLRGKAQDLFENYVHRSNKVSYVMIDPDKKPAIAKQYEITDYDTIVLESEDQRATARSLSEEGVTSALIRVSRGTSKRFYFIEGHGEHGIDDTEKAGYSFLKKSLEKQGFVVEKLHLLTTKSVPHDADVVVVGGPQRPLMDEEKAALKDYLDQGGQLLLLLDPMVESGLETFVSEWGLQLDDSLILDPMSGLGVAIPIINPDAYVPHEVTRNFNLATFYPLSRAIAFDASKGEGYRFDPFLETSADTWMTKEVAGELSINPGRDRKGPLILGGVLSESVPSGAAPPDPDKKKMRLVIVGDSDFGTNSVVQAAGNGDLFLNIVSWLADEGDLVAIRPQEIPTTTFVLSAQQTNLIFSVSVILLPLSVMGFGLFIWRGRRRL